MEALRKIQLVDSQRICIEVPHSFLNKRVEVILFPVDEEENYTANTWHDDFFASISGCFSEDRIIRHPQGEYDNRDDII